MTTGSPFPAVYSTVSTPSTTCFSRMNFAIGLPFYSLTPNTRDHFLGEQRHVLDRLPMRHIRNMHHVIEVIGLHAVPPLPDLIRDLLRSPHREEERLTDGVIVETAMHLVCCRRTD